MSSITNRRKWAMGTIAVFIFSLTAGVTQATAQTKKPNIIVIMGDDIGWSQPRLLQRGHHAERDA